MVLRMASAHFVSDAYSNLYTPLLPALIPRLGLSLTAAGTLAMLFQLATSVSQLGFGHLADRWRPRVLLVAGPIVSVLVLSLIGMAWSPTTLAIVLIVGGLGGAAFHPSAAAVVHRMGGSHRGFAMAFHITGGSVGYSLAPILFAPFVDRFGLAWTPALAIPGLVLLGFILARPAGAASWGDLPVVSGVAPAAARLFPRFDRRKRTVTSMGFARSPVMLTRRGWSLARLARRCPYRSRMGG